MSDAQAREALYARIRETSKDEVVLDEMIRLGFWRPDVDLHAQELTDLKRRRGETQRELQRIAAESARFSDSERSLKALNEERKKAARKRRRETKLAQAQRRQDRKESWAARSRDSVWHLGPGVSAALGPKSAAGRDALVAPGLPALSDPLAIARAMGVPAGELRFLSYARPLARISHYRRFAIPKKTGGERIISAPMPRLKYAQYWLLDAVLARVPVHEAAHGFVPGRSILTNARAHVGRDVVVNMDLKDFFPTVDDRRVKGLFESFGYSEAVAQVLALIATEPEADEIEIDGKRLWVARGHRRRLPQGAPCSPMITNLLCRKLDRRLSGLARKLGFAYTRYADDLTFSASGEAAQKTGTLLRAVAEIVRAEGFEPHPDKTRVMRKGARQEVTGLIVNERIGAPREAIRKARAALHQAKTKGVAGLRFGTGANPLASLRGFAQFVTMLDRRQGEALQAQVAALADSEWSRGGGEGRTPVPGVFAGFALRAAAAKGAHPAGWRWTPAERPAPTLDPVLAEEAKAQQRAREREEAKAAAQAAARTSVPSSRAGAAQPRSQAWNPRGATQGSAPQSAPQGRGERRNPGVAIFLFIVGLLMLPVFPIGGGVAWYFAWVFWRRK